MPYKKSARKRRTARPGYYYKDSRKLWHSGTFYRKPKRSMGLRWASTNKRYIRQRIALNRRDARFRLRNKYFRYTPRGGYKR